jgi:hypothetical protein
MFVFMKSNFIFKKIKKCIKKTFKFIIIFTQIIAKRFWIILFDI